MNRWLLRPRVLNGIALAVFVSIALFQVPWSPAASVHFNEFTGMPPFDERPAGYTLSGVLYAFDHLGAQGLFDYEAYRVLDLFFPWLLCGLVAAVMLRLDAARATMWPWRPPAPPKTRHNWRCSPRAATWHPSWCNGPAC
jgi:hypothetical protein